MNLIKEGRVNKGFTQEELAGLMGIDRSSVSRWESGNTFPRIDRLMYLSEILSIDLTSLLRGTVHSEE